MAEFWHSWGMKLAPAQVQRLSTRLNTILRSMTGTGPAKVTYNGEPVTTAVTYSTTAPSNSEISEKQNDILLALFEAYYRWSPEEDGVGEHGKARATISKSAGTAVNTPRNFSMRYPEDIRNALQQTLAAEAFRELNVRYRYALVDDANLARKKQGLPALNASGVLLAHPRLDLYVDVDSSHSFEAVGCTSCHDGSGQETDFVLAAHTPRDIFVDSRTGIPVLPAQFKDPKIEASEHAEKRDLSSMLAAVFPENLSEMKQISDLHFEKPATQPSAESEESHAAELPVDYVDPATGNQGQAIKQMAYWIKTYEPKAPRPFALVYHEWDWPMRTPEYLQANCARCHTDVYDIKETAPVLYEGRQLFTQMGCVNCHQMDSIPSYENRKVGTDLRHVTSKLSKEYINTWIWAPKSFRPTTKMPHFFMLENNSSDEEIRRTRQEARAITEYLTRTATPLEPAHIYPSSGQGNAEAGKAVFESIGCMACHQNLNERGEEWITTDLQKRAGLPEADAKSAYAAMSYNERQMYVQQFLAEPFGHNTKATYSDGSPKPVFVQVGPELSAIGTKLTTGRTPEQARQWLFDWVMEPRHYSEYTIMPRLRLTEQQAMDVAEYLLSQTRKKNDPKDSWSAGLTAVDTDKLIELTSLQLRSRYSVATSVVKADDDVELTSLATSALTTPVTPLDQAKAEVAKMSKDEKRMVFLGQKLIAHYGCMSCHAINGMETTSSPCANLSDWGQKSVDKLDYGYLDHHHVEEFLKEGVTQKDVMLVNGLSPEAGALGHEEIKGKKIASEISVTWPEVEHTRNAWITQKLKNTRIYDRGRALLEPDESAANPGKPYDKLKMPTFYLNDDQVNAIVTFVISNRDRLISEKLTEKATNEQARKIAHGRELTERYNCVACHQIEKNVPQIQQYYKPDEINTKAPPSLRGEGNKIQYSWLFNFFKNVEPLRPLLFQGIHMPSFPATDEEFSSIIAYFNSVSNKESKQLAKDIDPVVKYVDFQRKSTTRPSEPDAPWPGDDWYKRPEFARAADTLKEWGLTYGHIKPIEVGPTASPSDLNIAYRMLLFKARFTTDLYAAPFPFVDSPRPQITQARFDLGEKFFYELQCLKCHVLGDPNVPGANKTPTAPNLAMAATRLQQRWVRHWVQEPYIIQINTAMPPFFSGWKDKDDHIVASLQGQSWPRALKTDRDPDVIEAEYGKTVNEQMGLLLDFLYAAGARGFTGVQPTATTKPVEGNAPATQPQASLNQPRLSNPYIYTSK
jgi:cytochrome c551/c552